ncbi:hypothetical protein NHQ30_008344 [Ciborinia camelliae]|nr:hypothetical protein NHQ30_008344 [Ciborinia camelliae]
MSSIKSIFKQPGFIDSPVKILRLKEKSKKSEKAKEPGREAKTKDFQYYCKMKENPRKKEDELAKPISTIEEPKPLKEMACKNEMVVDVEYQYTLDHQGRLDATKMRKEVEDYHAAVEEIWLMEENKSLAFEQRKMVIKKEITSVLVQRGVCRVTHKLCREYRKL